MKIFARTVDVFVFVSLAFLLTTALAVCIDPPSDSLKLEQELSGLRALVGGLYDLSYRPEVYTLQYCEGDEGRFYRLGFNLQEGW